MTAASFPDQLVSPGAWLQRVRQNMKATSAESERDMRRPTELRYAPPATNDRQGSKHAGTSGQDDGAWAAQQVRDDLRGTPSHAVALIPPGTAGDRLDPALAALTAAAAAQDEMAFLAAYHAVDWAKSDAALFEAAIHLAFAAGAHMAARLLATQGAALHPDSDYLRRAAYVLAPPRVIARSLPAEDDTRANRAWMVANRDAFRGQWVALRNGELLGSAAKLKDLTTRFGIAPEILYAKVT